MIASVPVRLIDRPGLLGGLARRSSVIHLLVFLTMIPSIGLPVLGWSFVSDRYDLANSADRVAQGLRQVEQIDRLRTAIGAEESSELIRGGVSLFQQTPDVAALIPNTVLAKGSSSAATDAALAPVVRQGLAWIPGGNASLTTLRADLISAREATRQATIQGSAAVYAQEAVSQNPYFTVFREIQELENSAFDTIASGGLGISTPELLASTAQAQVVSSVVIQGSLLSQLYFAAQLDPSANGRLIGQLATTTANFDTLAEHLAPRLSSRVAQAWAKVLGDPQIRSFRAQVATFIAAAQRGQPKGLVLSASTIVPLLQSVATSITFHNALSPLLATSVTEAITLARDAQSAAASRARTGAVLALLALLITLSMLVLIGGLIRHRLTGLATAAQRLSSGTLLPMPVHWPREIAIASHGLNDAVTNLSEITTKAALIARGDISSPILERPSPGPLGAAMHASFESVVTMIRDRETLQHELARQASHDALTGLANRSEAERSLTEAVVTAREQHTGVGLLFIDLDHFKAINDTHGHAAGDHVLRTVSRRLTATPDRMAIPGRLGGDEFLVILPGLEDTGTLTEIAEGLAAAIREPIFYRDHGLEVGASIGTAHWFAPEETAFALAGTDAEIAELMLAEADGSMYRNKAANRTTR